MGLNLRAHSCVRLGVNVGIVSLDGAKGSLLVVLEEREEVIDARVAETTIAVGEHFDDFYRREFPKMVALASTVGAGRDHAEDIAQEAMLRAHRSWKKISAYDNPGTWARRVTINLATSTLRRKTSEFKAKIRLRGGQHNSLPADAAGTEPIWAAVAELPPKQRAAVALFYLEDLPVAEIALILDCSASTARVHLHHARTSLAEKVGTDGSLA